MLDGLIQLLDEAKTQDQFDEVRDRIFNAIDPEGFSLYLSLKSLLSYMDAVKNGREVHDDAVDSQSV